MKRLSSTQVQDYQRPRKSSTFSPSPIKRYQQKCYKSNKNCKLGQSDQKEGVGFSAVRNKLNHELRENLLPDSKQSSHQTSHHHLPNSNKPTLNPPTSALFSDNKENFPTSGIKPPNSLRFKQPLAPSILMPPPPNSNKPYPSLNTPSFIIPLKTSSLQNIEREMRSERDGNDMGEGLGRDKNELGKKRNAKLVEKREQRMGKVNCGGDENKENIDQYQTAWRKSTSRIQFQNLINKNIENSMTSQADSHSAENPSQLPPGVQFQGRWTSEEHKKFIEGLKLYGKDWRRIEEHIGSRTCAQIRSHAQKYFNRLSREITKDNSMTSDRVSEMAGVDDGHSHKTSNSWQQEREAIHNHTNQQLLQIQEKFSQLAEEEIQLQLQNLLLERELLAKKLMKRTVTPQVACEGLVDLTQKLHQLGVYAFSNNKCTLPVLFKDLVDLCKRLIDERNITQFICILLAQKVTLVPNYQVLQVDPNQPVIPQIIAQHKQLQQLAKTQEQQTESRKWSSEDQHQDPSHEEQLPSPMLSPSSHSPQ